MIPFADLPKMLELARQAAADLRAIRRLLEAGAGAALEEGRPAVKVLEQTQGADRG